MTCRRIRLLLAGAEHTRMARLVVAAAPPMADAVAGSAAQVQHTRGGGVRDDCRPRARARRRARAFPIGADRLCPADLAAVL